MEQAANNDCAILQTQNGCIDVLHKLGIKVTAKDLKQPNVTFNSLYLLLLFFDSI